METARNRSQRLANGIEIIVDEAKTVANEALLSAETIGGTLKDRLKRALSAREHVVMVRLNRHSLICMDDLVEAGIVNSRSEAAAFLIGEGIKARSSLFSRISEKTEMIRKTKQELSELLASENSDCGT